MSLLRVKVEYPAVWEGFQPYLSNLPSEQDVHTLFSFRKDLIPLLQDPEMVRPWRAAVPYWNCIGKSYTENIRMICCHRLAVALQISTVAALLCSLLANLVSHVCH